MWKSTSFVFFMMALAAAACAHSADEALSDTPPPPAGPASADADITQYPTYEAGPDAATGADGTGGVDSPPPQDSGGLPDVDLDGPPPPPPPPPPDGGNPAICDTSNPIGAGYYFYEFTKATNPQPCPCTGKECCYMWFPFPQVCLNRGY
jgi:hypothetical protein